MKKVIVFLSATSTILTRNTALTNNSQSLSRDTAKESPAYDRIRSSNLNRKSAGCHNSIPDILLLPINSEGSAVTITSFQASSDIAELSALLNDGENLVERCYQKYWKALIKCKELFRATAVHRKALRFSHPWIAKIAAQWEKSNIGQKEWTLLAGLALWCEICTLQNVCEKYYCIVNHPDKPKSGNVLYNKLAEQFLDNPICKEALTEQMETTDLNGWRALNVMVALPKSVQDFQLGPTDYRSIKLPNEKCFHPWFQYIDTDEPKTRRAIHVFEQNYLGREDRLDKITEALRYLWDNHTSELQEGILKNAEMYLLGSGDDAITLSFFVIVLSGEMPDPKTFIGIMKSAPLTE